MSYIVSVIDLEEVKDPENLTKILTADSGKINFRPQLFPLPTSTLLLTLWVQQRIRLIDLLSGQAIVLY